MKLYSIKELYNKIKEIKKVKYNTLFYFLYKRNLLIQVPLKPNCNVVTDYVYEKAIRYYEILTQIKTIKRNKKKTVDNSAKIFLDYQISRLKLERDNLKKEILLFQKPTKENINNYLEKEKNNEN